MKRMSPSASVLVLAALLACAPGAQAEPIVIGDPASSVNCFPFGCRLETFASTRYQQVYNSSSFSSTFRQPVVISGIHFFQTNFPGGVFNVGTFEFYLSTTARRVDGLDTTNFDQNRGADNSLFAVVPFTGAEASPRLSIAGASFLYDPRLGNLLLDIVIPGGATRPPGPDAHATFFDAHSGTAGGVFSRAHNFGSGFSGYGLVTGFDAAPVPEPTSMLLVGTGGVALIARARRRRKTRV